MQLGALGESRLRKESIQHTRSLLPVDLHVAIARESHELILQTPHAFPNVLEVEEEGSYGEYDAEVE